MLTKHQKMLSLQWRKGTLNLIKAARRMGYKKGSLTKGVHHVREILMQMGITVL